MAEPSPPSPVDSTVRQRAVAGDLEAIFASAGEPAPHQPLAAVLPASHRQGASPRRTLLGRIGAVATVALIGLCAGAGWMVLSERLAATPADRDIAAAAQMRVAVAAPVVETAALDAPVIALRPAAKPVAAVAEPAAKRRGPEARQVASDMDSQPPREAVPVASAEPCADASAQEYGACMHDVVLSADRRLRRAYAEAGEAGVPRQVMVFYRDQWSSLRRRATRDPEGVAAGYRDIAAELESEIRRARLRSA